MPTRNTITRFNSPRFLCSTKRFKHSYGLSRMISLMVHRLLD